MDPFFAILVVALVGLCTWLVLTFIPMPDAFRKIVLAVAVIGTVLWLLAGFGIFHLRNHIP